MGLPFFKELVQRNLFYKLSERSETDFNGRNLFEQKCANARICDDTCRGRPVPKYPELEPFIHKYNPSEGVWNGQDVWLIKVDTCASCPFKVDCTKTCPSVSAFHIRNNNPDDLHLEMAQSMDAVSDTWLEQLYQEDEEGVWVNRLQLTRDDIAWDCLSEPQEAAVMLVEVQGKTFEQAAKLRGVSHQAVQKSYESAMAKLKEFGTARRALSDGSDCNYARDYYQLNMKQADIALKHAVSQKTVSAALTDFRKKYDIIQ